MSGLGAFLGQLRFSQEVDSVPALEPDVDNKDLGDVGDGVQIR